MSRPRMPRTSLVMLILLTFLTCGLGLIYIGWVQNRAIKALNPKALDPMLAFTLDLIGWLFTGGLLNLGVTYFQTKCLMDYAERQGHVHSNPGLLTTVMAWSCIGLVSVWLSFTGVLAFLALAGGIYSMWITQTELMLYTRA